MFLLMSTQFQVIQHLITGQNSSNDFCCIFFQSFKQSTVDSCSKAISYINRFGNGCMGSHFFLSPRAMKTHTDNSYINIFLFSLREINRFISIYMLFL